MVTNECHLVSEQSNKQVFILSRDRNKNHSTYTLTLCILNAELRVTTPVEPVLCGQLSGMFHLDICSDLLTVGVYVMPLQRKVKTFIFCGVMCFPNQFLYSWLFIWELWLNLEWWTCARCAFIWNTVDMTPNSLYSLLLVFIRLYFFGSLPNLKRQEMGVSKIWHSFLWKEGRKCVIPIFFFWARCSLPISLLLLCILLHFCHPLQTPIWLLCAFLITKRWRAGSILFCIKYECTVPVCVCGSAFSLLQVRLWTSLTFYRWSNTA